MSAKTFIKPYKIVTDGDMSASITSPVTAVQMVDNIAYQLNFTGAPVGTFSFQVSMDYEPGVGPNSEPRNPGTWITLPVTPAIVASGAPDSAFVDLNQQGTSYVRVVYNRTSGTGTLQVFVTAKSLS